MKKLMTLSLLFLSACGLNVTTNNFPSPSPTPNDNTVQTLVASYNQWREAQGQEDIIPGLDCTLYTVPTSTTQIVGTSLNVVGVTPSVGSFEYTGTFDVQNELTSLGNPILPTALQSVYQNWYIMRCTGFIVIPTSGYTEFDVSSDDGSNLYVDGSLLVNNDGLHSIQTVSGVKNLEMNVHSFELDYLQGGGYQALIVNMNQNLLPAGNLYH